MQTTLQTQSPVLKKVQGGLDASMNFLHHQMAEVLEFFSQWVSFRLSVGLYSISLIIFFFLVLAKGGSETMGMFVFWWEDWDFAATPLSHDRLVPMEAETQVVFPTCGAAVSKS